MSEINRYVILGEPLAYREFRNGLRREFDEQAKEKLRFNLSVINSHADRPIYKGPLHIELLFFFGFNNKANINSMKTPKIASLIKFVEESLAEIISHNNCNIASLVTKKLFDCTPRTEFIIKEIQNDKKDKEE